MKRQLAYPRASDEGDKVTLCVVLDVDGEPAIYTIDLTPTRAILLGHRLIGEALDVFHRKGEALSATEEDDPCDSPLN